MFDLSGYTDDETDPDNPTSFPRDRPPISEWQYDTDGDGLADDEEDVNDNGIFDAPDPTDWMDLDTDDDGLDDFYECTRGGMANLVRRYFSSPADPDTDKDGLPDGLEVGVTKPVKGLTITLDGHEFVIKGTDLEATFDWDQGGSVVQRSCFIADLDPKSFTDPATNDTNFDGLDDGAQDANGNGQADAGETDPAAGLRFFYEGTQYPKNYLQEGMGFFLSHGQRSFLYMSPTDNAPPTVTFSDPAVIGLFGEAGLINEEGTRLWWITLAPKSVGTATVQLTHPTTSNVTPILPFQVRVEKDPRSN